VLLARMPAPLKFACHALVNLSSDEEYAQPAARANGTERPWFSLNLERLLAGKSNAGFGSEG